MAKNKFATVVAPTLATVSPTVSAPNIDPNKMVTMSYGDLLAALAAARGEAPAAAPAKAPKTRKTPAQVPVTQVAPTAAPVASGPIDFALKGKEAECYRAAKAAVKTAGLAWNGVKGQGSKGGKFENPKLYWATYWAGYNAKAIELGIPTHEVKAQ